MLRSLIGDESSPLHAVASAVQAANDREAIYAPLADLAVAMAGKMPQSREKLESFLRMATDAGADAMLSALVFRRMTMADHGKILVEMLFQSTQLEQYLCNLGNVHAHAPPPAGLWKPDGLFEDLDGHAKDSAALDAEGLQHLELLASLYRCRKNYSAAINALTILAIRPRERGVPDSERPNRNRILQAALSLVRVCPPRPCLLRS
jgi:hypothetical protein